MDTSGLTPSPALDDSYPALAEAYGFVLPSYQWLVARFESADARLTHLLTVTTTLTLGVPVFARAVRPSSVFSSRLFVAALALFVLVAVLGVVARMYGRIVLPNPAFLYVNTLHESVAEFRKNTLYYAGRHFDVNARTIKIKGHLADAMTMALLLEMFLFVLWIAR